MQRHILTLESFMFIYYKLFEYHLKCVHVLVFCLQGISIDLNKDGLKLSLLMCSLNSNLVLQI